MGLIKDNEFVIYNGKDGEEVTTVKDVDDDKETATVYTSSINPLLNKNDTTTEQINLRTIPNPPIHNVPLYKIKKIPPKPEDPKKIMFDDAIRSFRRAQEAQDDKAMNVA